MLYRISVTERGLTGIANIFRSRLSGLDDFLRAGTVPLSMRQPSRSSITGLSLRNHDSHSLPCHRLILFLNSYLPSTTRLWNSLPSVITASVGKHTFRRRIYDHFEIKRPPAFHSSGTILGNTIHAQLRLNMSILNAHLFSIKGTNPALKKPSNIPEIYAKMFGRFHWSRL